MSSTRETAGSQRPRGWLSLRQAATIYGVSVDTLRRRITVGKLPARRFGPRLEVCGSHRTVTEEGRISRGGEQVNVQVQEIYAGIP